MALSTTFVAHCEELLNQQANYPQTIQTQEDRALVEQQVTEIEAILAGIEAVCSSPEDSDLIKVVRGSFYTLLGNALQQLSRFQEALSALKTACEYLKDSSALGVAKMYYHYGWILSSLKEYDQAENCYKESLTRYQQHGKEVFLKEIADIHNNLGRTFDLRNRLPDAIEEYTTAIELKQALPDSVEARDSLANTYNNLAWVKQKQKNFQEAYDLYMKALQTASPSAGQLRGTIYNNLAQVCAELTRFIEAERYFKQAVDTKEQVHGSESDKLAFTLNAYASFLMQYSPQAAEKALSKLQRAKEIYLKIHPNNPEHADLRTVNANIIKANQLIAESAVSQSAAGNPNALFAIQKNTSELVENAAHANIFN